MGSIRQGALRVANAFLRFNDARIESRVSRVSSHPATPAIVHQKVFPVATYSPWLNDAEFLRCYEKIKANTLVDIYRCYELWTLAKQFASVDGDFLEVGVWRGGTGCLLASALRDSGKTVFLADTFTGVVKAGERDTVYVGGEHADTSEQLVRKLAEDLSLKNVAILKGIFPDDTGGRIEGGISFLHCDVDVYTSAKDVVSWVMPRLSVGGAIVFDDYGFKNCEGVTTLVNELRQTGEFLYIHNLNGHGILVRK